MDGAKVRRIAAFFLLALAGTAVVGILGWAGGVTLSPALSTVTLALVMWAPLLAGYAVRRERPSLKAWIEDWMSSYRRSWRLVLLAPGAMLVVWAVASVVLTALLGGAAGLASAGSLSDTPVDEAARLLGVDASELGDVNALPAGLFVSLAVAGGLVAGATINGWVAYGEEHGWRHHLFVELEDASAPTRIFVTGVLWGLWHAPLIVLVGFNYRDHRALGVVLMVFLTLALSWPMDELRRASGSAVPPAVLHGMFNGAAGAMLLAVGGDLRVAAPLGVGGALAWLAVGAVCGPLVKALAPATEASPRDAG